MKLHAKSVVILIVTLLIGVAIGALWLSSVHNRRAEQLAEMRRQGGIYDNIERYIDPVDSLQAERLRSLASAYQDTLGRFWRHYMYHRTELMRDFEQDLLPELTPEQTTLIQPYLERITRTPRSLQRDSTRTATSDSTSVTSDSTSASND